LFEIITPEIEKGEVFDSTSLKTLINTLIAEGKRNFAVDLAPLDYLYSDAINVILALNRRILDVSGRLSLLGPTPEVRQILDRAGIQNILKVYESEADLLKSSEDIILQTTGFSLSELQAHQHPKVSQPPKSEFDELRSEISDVMMSGDAEPPSRYAPQTRQADSVSQEQVVPAPARQQPPITGTHKKIAPQKPVQVNDEPPSNEYEEFTRDEGDGSEKKKGSPLPAIIIAAVVVILGVGGFLAYSMFGKSAQKDVDVSAQVPQVQQTTASSVAKQESAKPAEVKPEPRAEIKPVKVAPEPVQRAEPAKKERTTKVVSKPVAPVPVAPASASSGGKITIMSNPPGGTIKVEDKVIGVTPFTWNKPTVFGEVMVSVSKPGYKDVVKVVEYTGGTVSEIFILVKDESAVPAAAKPAAQSVVAPPQSKPAAAEPVAPPPPKALGEPATIFISSIPPMADVYMDGKLIGKTNVAKLNVFSGTHSMRFVKGAKEQTEDKKFVAGDNPSWFVQIK